MTLIPSTCLSTPSLGITWQRKRKCFTATSLKLSTPSLGITRISPKPLYLFLRSSFQLPLSGSLGHRSRDSYRGIFDTFNSLSRDHRLRCPYCGHVWVPRTFNSLSRDHLASWGSMKPRRRTFNSLSRDHWSEAWWPRSSPRSAFQLPLSGSLVDAFVDLFRHYGSVFQLPLSGSLASLIEQLFVTGIQVFQLPLSGSPSPIPGFFGSPRLSAAAPLRTNDF